MCQIDLFKIFLILNVKLKKIRNQNSILEKKTNGDEESPDVKRIKKVGNCLHMGHMKSGSDTFSHSQIIDSIFNRLRISIKTHRVCYLFMICTGTEHMSRMAIQT
jgi:hypothetical protein